MALSSQGARSLLHQAWQQDSDFESYPTEEVLLKLLSDNAAWRELMQTLVELGLGSPGTGAETRLDCGYWDVDVPIVGWGIDPP
jgi:hypothetical protein